MTFAANLATTLASVTLFSSLILLVSSQHDFTSNLTDISGTWSSGWGSVRTGAGFVNPVNFTFFYPSTSGISMSFTNDGYWEEAQYRFISNGTRPNCVKAVVLWQHGSYRFENNGSLTMQPIEADGRIQVQDPCAAQTSVITNYFQPGLYQSWQIYNDVHHNTFNLQLQAFDNALFPRLYLVSRPPDMLPTNQLTNTKKPSNKKRSLPDETPNSLWKRWYGAWTS